MNVSSTAPPGIALRDLAALTLIDRLERLGYVDRARSGRVLELSLTAAGPRANALGPGRAFLVPLAMLVGVAAIAVWLPRRAGLPRRTEARSGWASGRVIGLIGLSVAYYFTYGPFDSVLPYFTREQLDSGVGGYTLLWVLFGAAALATLPFAPWLADRRPGLVNACRALVWGLVTLPIVLTDSLPAAAAIFLVSGAVWGPYSAIEATALQRWADPASHGAMFGTQRALLSIAFPLGAAVGAVAVDHVSPAVILAVSALCCAAAGAVAMVPLRR